MSGHELHTGTAGEHLVCADLLARGVTAFRADQTCSFDVAALVGGRLVRIQVKTTAAPRPVPQRRSYLPAYQWFVRRCGKNGAKDYQPDAFDLLALVALDSKRIAYLPPSSHRRTIHIRSEERPGGKTFAMFPWESAAAEVLR